jgi:hypothetical protein
MYGDNNMGDKITAEAECGVDRKWSNWKAGRQMLTVKLSGYGWNQREEWKKERREGQWGEKVDTMQYWRDESGVELAF